MEKNIFLIGFMGAGKSTVARELEKQLNRPLVEMDETIVKQQKMSINEIFETYGEAYFRELETKLVRTLRDRGGSIVSCGGGVVMRQENVEEMKKNGVIVLLTASAETIYERVRYSTNRPLLNGNMNVEHITHLMESRLPKYENAADFTVKTDGRALDDIVKDIIEKYKSVS